MPRVRVEEPSENISVFVVLLFGECFGHSGDLFRDCPPCARSGSTPHNIESSSGRKVIDGGDGRLTAPLPEKASGRAKRGEVVCVWFCWRVSHATSKAYMAQSMSPVVPTQPISAVSSVTRSTSIKSTNSASSGVSLRRRARTRTRTPLNDSGRRGKSTGPRGTSVQDAVRASVLAGSDVSLKLKNS